MTRPGGIAGHRRGASGGRPAAGGGRLSPPEDAEARERIRNQFPDALFISALKGEGLQELLEAISTALSASQSVADYVVPFDRGDVRSQMHELGEVMEESGGEDGWRLTVKGPRSVLGKFGDFVAPFHPEDNGAAPDEEE